MLESLHMPKTLTRCKIPHLLAIGFAIIAVIGLATTTSAEAKTRKHSSGSPYLVPPPPAYMPAILPELYQVSGAPKPAPKPKNPYKKYVFTAEGYEQPKPTTQRSGVSYWKPPEQETKKAN